MKQTYQEKKFNALTNQWYEETGMLSNPTSICKNEHCQAIVAMGEHVIPWMLEDMRDNNRSMWCFVLRQMIKDGGIHVEQEDRGVVYKIKTLWLEWGMEQGLIDHIVQTFRCHYCSFVNHEHEPYRQHIKACFDAWKENQ